MTSIQGKVRIIGGQWRSRLITFPKQPDLRPTPDRIRETLFNWLGQDLEGTQCLDLFAGSGVLGFEAASRGAGHVVMVESSSIVYKSLLINKDKLKAEQVELERMDVSTFLASDSRQFDVIFLDPPYRRESVPELLAQLSTHLIKSGQVYFETESKWMPGEPWKIRRSGKAGKVNYQLLELYNHG